MTRPGLRPGPTEFLASLGLLALLSLAVVLALAFDGSRPKALRVGLAAGAYLLVLTAAATGAGLAARRAGAAARLPSARVFLLAGGAAGLVSGMVREEIAAPVLIVQTLLAAVLLGGFHWSAMRLWRRVRGFITSRYGNETDPSLTCAEAPNPYIRGGDPR